MLFRSLNLSPSISQTHHRVSLFSTFKSSRHAALPRNEAQRVTALRTTAHSLSPTLEALGLERPDTRRSHPPPHTSACKCTGPTSPMQGTPSHPPSPDVNLPPTHMTHVLETRDQTTSGVDKLVWQIRTLGPTGFPIGLHWLTHQPRHPHPPVIPGSSRFKKSQTRKRVTTVVPRGPFSAPNLCKTTEPSAGPKVAGSHHHQGWGGAT